MYTAVATLDLLDRLRRKAELPPPAMRKMIRLSAGATLYDIGAACGVSHEAVRLWESNRRFPSEANLVRYAAVLEALRADLLKRGGGLEGGDLTPAA
jgi:transcriptional regulator with XRE-family HTH domain